MSIKINKFGTQICNNPLRFKMTSKVFLKNGFTIYKNVLEERLISELREEIRIEFKSLQKNHMFTRNILNNPKISKIPFLKSVNDCVKDTFDNFTIIPIYSLTQNLHSPKWHRDSQSAGKYSSHLYDKDYQVSKCGIYLQDDSLDWGGGLEIIPKSHKAGPLGYKPFWKFNIKQDFRISELQMKAQQLRDDYFLRKKRLFLNAGDLIIFHGNLLHRASQPSRPLSSNYTLSDIEPSVVKYMYQWEVSPQNDHLQKYITHQKNRLKTLKEYDKPFISEAVESNFPESYSEEVVNNVRGMKLSIASL